MRVRHTVVILACVLLANCGSTPVKPQSVINLSASQIQLINNYDELVNLRKTLTAGLVGKLHADYADDYAALAQIDSQLVELKKAQLSTHIASARLPSGVVSLSVLDNLDSVNTATVDATKWAEVYALIDVEKVKTRKRIETIEEGLSAENLDTAGRIDILGILHELTGSDQWLNKQDAEIESIISDIRAATAAEEFDADIRAKIALVRQVRGNDAALVDELISVDAKIYAKSYFDALASGSADSAYDILVTMSQAKDFLAIKEKLTPSSEKMADYFTALAVQSVEKIENLPQSYRWYIQAREVRKILGLDEVSAESVSELVNQLYLKYEETKKAGDEAAALSYLYSVQKFNSRRLGLRKTLNEQELIVRESAVKRLSTTDFQSSYKDQDYGDVISSFVTQYLFEHVPHDVRIVEREQYEAILRERELSGNKQALSSVNLLVSGSVLESKVDSAEAKNKKNYRVTVGKDSISNPAYISWLKMPSKERDKIPSPSETIDVDRQENVSVGVTRHRKVGIFSVSYRLVEASTGRVLFPDSITLSDQFEDESSEGVEMGDFIVPFKLADLPSDVQILDKLARRVATKIGEKLVLELKDQEKKYLSQADAFVEQNDCVAEVESLANALMIMKLKSQDEEVVKTRLRNQTVACY
ncbi:MAG: curli biogenesis system outer membrane secretion channel CsgG [Flavobacteriales bacterium]|jgi:curli biogenesis system outer membrane secretion channel CsgG